MSEYILEAEHLKKYFYTGKNSCLKAVDDVSFTLKEGEVLGIVGESGCGKTTCGKTCMGIYDNTAGSVRYRGKDIREWKNKEHKQFAKEVQMIFQDPYTSLDPHMKICDIVAEGLKIHKLTCNKQDEREKVNALLEDVGLHAEYANRYIHEFSGGQRQRIGIARALAVEPKLLVADEPVSALDVSVQAQIINLLMRLQRERNLSMVFIAHDIAVVRYISQKIGVMYLGTMVEMADSETICKNPLHPYTQALISAIPIADPEKEQTRERIILNGEMPSPQNPPQGCRFCDRCPNAVERCREEMPQWKEVGANHYAACHFV